ncbi:PIN domain-containing protein [Olsenella sp. Marseille-P4559]|uniref:type II toxin-antitoxin system VapC family toxin n=1 Tax=Olsenella sp. Marseille-P4559 TaxID=2364795 RepID=UPI0013EF1F06|nr:PIN domain-containing protein [Olsenella sp. Marseille-P4559]
MSVTPHALLLDTNVWLDNYLPFRVGHDAATHLLEYAQKSDVRLLYAMGSCQGLAYALRASAKEEFRRLGRQVDQQVAVVARDFSLDCLANLRVIATAVGADESDLWLAERYLRVHHDVEDCLVMAAAARSKADWLVTSDEALLRHAPIPALCPSDLLALVGAEGA